MSLLEALARLPSGRTIGGGIVSWDTVTKHLRDHYLFNGEEKKRKERMRKRLDFYQDNAHRHIRERLRKLFKHELTRELRMALEELSHSNNVTKRIVNLTSTVYASPAQRTVPFDQDDFDAYERETRMHNQHRRAQRIGNLCNAALLYPMMTPTGRRRLRIVAPSDFSVVAHPLDTSDPIAYIFDLHIKSSALNERRVPQWLVIDDTFSFFMDQKGLLIGDSVEEHGAERIPATLYAKSADDSQVLDSTTGQDVISAHEAITVLQILALKNAKSGAKMSYAIGDTTRTTMRQAMDEESMLTFPEGVSPGTLDLNASPDAYIKLASDISNQVFGNRGIPEPLRAGTNVTSGEHLSLLKAELADLRADDLIDWREVEHDRAELDFRVFGLDTREYRVDFAETTTPRSRMQQLDIDKRERNEGRSNIIEQMMRDDPDLTAEDAWGKLRDNIEIHGEWMGHVRALNAPMDGETGQPPQDNGAMDGQQASIRRLAREALGVG